MGPQFHAFGPSSDMQGQHYPEIEEAVVAVPKEFAKGVSTGRHSHRRGQLLYATKGMMVATTGVGTWFVPPSHALWIPRDTEHEVAMHGCVSMRTAYIDQDAFENLLPRKCRVIAVNALLSALLVALCACLDERAAVERRRHLSALIVDEIANAAPTPFALPLPQDRRLSILTRRLIANPPLNLDIDGWCLEVGVSRRTLTRCFLRQTGMSFGTWRRRLRLLAAAALVAEGAPLSRAAMKVGYRSADAFKSMARKELGCDWADFAAAL